MLGCLITIKLCKELDRHKLVLYEYVAPSGSVPPATSGRDPGILGAVLSSFGMQYQLDGISYNRKHFVHADLSPDQLLQAAQERGEDPLTLGLGVIKDLLNSANMAKQGAGGQPSTLPQSASDLMLLFARTLVDQGGAETAAMRTIKPYLLDIRNQEVVRILGQKLGEGHKDIAIFFVALALWLLLQEVPSVGWQPGTCRTLRWMHA